ncbi:hypothetical protein [Paenibacillus wuxiensis]
MKGKSAEYQKKVGDIVYQAMIDTLNVPANDRSRSLRNTTPMAWCTIPRI